MQSLELLMDKVAQIFRVRKNCAHHFFESFQLVSVSEMCVKVLAGKKNLYRILFLSKQEVMTQREIVFVALKMHYANDIILTEVKEKKEKEKKKRRWIELLASPLSLR